MTYLKVLEDIKKTAESVGRNPKEITLVAVTKGHSWNEVDAMYQQGQRVFGENRIQEAIEKIENAPKDCHWHLIGTLQKNKVRKALSLFEMIHSVDSLELLTQISKCSLELGKTTRVLLQVNTSGEVTKHGFTPEGCREYFPMMLQLEGIAVEGFMTMAPLANDENVIRNCFKELRLLRDDLQSQFPGNLLKHLSMGMSHDYKIAIEEGATLLRIGTALFS